jgi:hypothetical protein
LDCICIHDFLFGEKPDSPALNPMNFSFLSYLWELRVFGLLWYLNRLWHLWFLCSGLWLSYLCLQHTWEDKFILPHSPFYWLRWGFFLFLVDCGLNSWLHTCKVGSLLLEPHLRLKIELFSTLCLFWPWITIFPISISQKLRLKAWATIPSFKYCW